MATRTTKRMWIMLLAVVLLIGVLALVKFLQIRKLIASIPKPQPQVVSTVKATKLEWQPQFDAVGSLVAVRGVDVSSEIAGQVRELRQVARGPHRALARDHRQQVTREQLEQPIRAFGKGVEASLAAFSDGFDAITRKCHDRA